MTMEMSLIPLVASKKTVVCSLLLFMGGSIRAMVTDMPFKYFCGIYSNAAL